MSVLFGVCIVLVMSLLDTEGCEPPLILTNNEGSIDPGYLPMNAVCHWTINAPEGKVVRIWSSILGFQLRPGDYFRIHDGANDSSRLVASYNYADPLNDNIFGVYFISSGRSLWLQLKTGFSTKKHNLKVYYRYQENPGCSMNINLKAPKWPMKKNFTSPAYWPVNYQSDLTCGWYIEAPENYTVQLTISLSWMQKYLYSIQVFNKDGSVLSPFTLYDFNIILSKYRSAVYILIKSDLSLYKGDNYNPPGIYVEYTAMRTACIWNNTLQAQTEIQKTIFMPLWSIYYRGQKSCGWYIKASKNQAITLEMKTSREFEGTTTYTNDTLWVYNAEGSELKLIRSFNFPSFRPTLQYTTPVTQLIYIFLESENQPSSIIDRRLSSVGYKAVEKGSKSRSSALKILLACLGGIGAIILCVVIAVGSHKYFISRRNQTNWQQMS